MEDLDIEGLDSEYFDLGLGRPGKRLERRGRQAALDCPLEFDEQVEDQREALAVGLGRQGVVAVLD